MQELTIEEYQSDCTEPRITLPEYHLVRRMVLLLIDHSYDQIKWYANAIEYSTIMRNPCQLHGNTLAYNAIVNN
jgi:hypothetical protein